MLFWRQSEPMHTGPSEKDEANASWDALDQDKLNRANMSNPEAGNPAGASAEAFTMSKEEPKKPDSKDLANSLNEIKASRKPEASVDLSSVSPATEAPSEGSISWPEKFQVIDRENERLQEFTKDELGNPVPVAPEAAPQTPEGKSEVIDLEALAAQRTEQIVAAAKRVGAKVLGFLARVAGMAGKTVAATELGVAAAGQKLESGRQYVGQKYEAGKQYTTDTYQSGVDKGRQVATAASEAWQQDKARTAEHYQAARDAVVGGAARVGEVAYQAGEAVVGGATRAYEATMTGAERARDWGREDVRQTGEDFRKLGEMGIDAWKASREFGGNVLTRAGAGAESARQWASDGVARMKEAGALGVETTKEVGRQLAIEAQRFVAEKRERAGSYIERRIAEGKAAIERVKNAAVTKAMGLVYGARLAAEHGRTSILEARVKQLVEGSWDGKAKIDAKIQANSAIIQRGMEAQRHLATTQEEFIDDVEARVEAIKVASKMKKLTSKAERLSAKEASLQGKIAEAKAKIAALEAAKSSLNAPAQAEQEASATA